MRPAWRPDPACRRGTFRPPAAHRAPPLSPRGEKTPQYIGGLGLADAAVELRRVMANGLREKTRAMLDRAALRIGRGPIKAAQAGEGNRRRAHGAGFKRDV